MDFIDRDIQTYAENYSAPETEALADLNRLTQLRTLRPRMLSGHLQGRILAFLSKLAKPTNVLEIGTFTGYSAICLAEGLAPNGHIHTIEKNPEMENFCLSAFENAGVGHKITLHIGDAVALSGTLPGPWDLIFVDAHKPEYKQYVEAALPQCNPGALLIADNVLWSGKVANPDSRQNDPDTAVLHSFNQFINQHPNIDNLLLPVRDGLMLGIINP